MTLGIALIVAVLSGCGSGTAKQDPKLLVGDWTVVSLRSGAALSPVSATEPAPTARFASTTITGSGGVNSYRAEYRTSDADAIAITLGPITKVAGPPALMAQENAYLSAVADARHYRVTGDSLDLLDNSGARVVTYAHAVPVTLENNLWMCRGYNNGKEAVVSLAASSTITVRFGTDGRLTGSGGVNQYSSNYSASGNSMKIDVPFAMTRMAGPKVLMDQERAYLSALEHTARFEITGTTLDLWGSGSMGRVATFELAKP